MRIGANLQKYSLHIRTVPPDQHKCGCAQLQAQTRANSLKVGRILRDDLQEDLHPCKSVQIYGNILCTFGQWDPRSIQIKMILHECKPAEILSKSVECFEMTYKKVWARANQCNFTESLSLLSPLKAGPQITCPSSQRKV